MCRSNIVYMAACALEPTWSSHAAAVMGQQHILNTLLSLSSLAVTYATATQCFAESTHFCVTYDLL